MRRTLLLLISLVSGMTLFAQEFEVPIGYVFKTEEDFKKFEPDVILCINWVLETAADSNLEKRQDATFFIMSWLDKNPVISLEINPGIVNFMETNPDLMLIFLCAWTKYTLESGDVDKVNGNIKGLEGVIDYYLKNKGKLQKDKHVEKYVKMKEEGQLQEFVRKTIE